MSSLKKNLVYNISYQVLILIVPFITAPYVSRVLGPTGLGTYSVTTATTKIFVMFAAMGMASYGNRTIAQNRKNKQQLSQTFWNLFFFQLLISAIVLGAFLVYLGISGIQTYGIVSVCQLPYMLSSIFEISWFFFGIEDFKGIVTRNIIVKVLTTAAVFPFVNSPEDIWIYTFINAVSFLVGQLCLWPFLRKYICFCKPQWKVVLGHFKPNCILMVSVVAVSIYGVLSKIILEYFSDTANVGYYENTEKLINIANNAAGAIGAVMLPRLANIKAEQGAQGMKKYMDKSMYYIMILAITLSFGIAGISSCFSVTYFGADFEPCGKLLLISAPAIIFYAWSNIIRNQYLLPNGMDSVFVGATISAAFVNVSINLLCTPQYGAIGAALGLVGAQFAELFYQTWKVRRSITVIKYIMDLIPFALFGLIMYVYCAVLNKCLTDGVTLLMLQICGGAFIYIGLSVVWLLYKKDSLLCGLIEKMKLKKRTD